MVPRSGCTCCRERHIKCVINQKSESCVACDRARRQCVQDCFFRFKLVKTVSQRSGGDTRCFSLSYSPQQTWLPIPETLSFVGDSGRGLDVEFVDPTTPPSYDAEVQSCGPNSTIMLASEDDVADDETRSWNKELSQEVFSQEELSPGELSPEEFSPGELSPDTYNSFGPSSLTAFDVSFHENATSTSSTNRLFSAHSSQAILSPLKSSQVLYSPTQNSVYNAPLPTLHRSGSSSSLSQEDLPFSSQEAFLLRNYIENLSPWADVCDPLRHFATVVPQRAVLNVQSKCENTNASTYYSKSQSLLIPILSDLTQTYDENVLAAVVVLRMYEEREVMDEKCHLLGQSRLLNSMAKFSHCGGLGEAASWVSLRQDIYISMISKQPISIDLKIYEKSQSFEKKDDGSWANVMVYLFARVLALAFSPNNNQSHDEWQYLDRSIEEWNTSKPKTFSPMSFHRPALSNDRTFKEIWMLNSFHVVGIQYYYLAKIFLKAYKPSPSVFGFGACHENRMIESSIAEYLGIILGLSFGNPLVQNVWFTTSHILSACGCYLRGARERRAAIEFLEMMEKKTGWRTSPIASSLQKQWTCLDNEA